MNTPLHTAIQDCKDVLSELEMGDYAKYFLELGDPCVDIIEMLLARGADPTIRNKNHETPVSMAARLGKIEALKPLISNIKDVVILSEAILAALKSEQIDDSTRSAIVELLRLEGSTHCIPTIVEINNDMDGEDAEQYMNNTEAEDPEYTEDNVIKEEKKKEEEEVWERTETEAPIDHSVLLGTEISTGQQQFANFMRNYEIGDSAL